jgi:hypothetical protein
MFFFGENMISQLRHPFQLHSLNHLENFDTYEVLGNTSNEVTREVTRSIAGLKGPTSQNV